MATIVTRSGKGSPLTHAEVDANFENLNSDKIESGDTVASLTITSADINGGTIDGAVIGGSSAAAVTGTTGTFINVSDGTLSIPTTYVTNGSAKAWLNMNGTGTIAIRDSFNLSGLVDNGTGSYSFNLTNAFASSNYVPHGSGFRAGVGFALVDYRVSSASSISVASANTTGSFSDISDIKGSAFGDLA
jgi:hypothetical protein